MKTLMLLLIAVCLALAPVGVAVGGQVGIEQVQIEAPPAIGTCAKAGAGVSGHIK